jgi:hypothetical protein
MDWFVFRQRSLSFFLARSETTTNVFGDNQQIPSTVQ